ncbi:GlxA family transcriptional regulator [Nocardia sp. alder85J]|uniref:GlxA family transcriptional regulator n=1 Tax=Nocardia sp. alder85J TaxID=2862949 RepID=UPI001CD1F285|nr:helix-turn-helix domain-containing protein [Nocardia sp. alder85J]MCX4091472.1 helix-turn-helix domain-containing protein [Nocardia sp. alder85J]
MNVAILVVDGVADFGLAALLETLHTANSLRAELDNAPPPWTVRCVSLGADVRSGYGHLIPTVPLGEFTGAADVMIVPAVAALEADSLIRLVAAPESRATLELLECSRASGVHLAAACTGTFFLAEAGVLDGQPATTSWWLGPVFRRRYPKAELDEARTLCRGDQVTTAGASLSHLDLALSLVQAQSPALATLVARYMAVGNRKSQAVHAIPEVVARGNALVADFERWMRTHLSEPVRLADVARTLGATERGLQRAMQAELGKSPQEFVHDIRLERAAELLRTTTLTVDAVAARVGYQNASTLRTLIRRRRGVTVAEIRAARSPW